MKRINNYILEKLGLKKDIEIGTKQYNISLYEDIIEAIYKYLKEYNINLNDVSYSSAKNPISINIKGYEDLVKQDKLPTRSKLARDFEEVLIKNKLPFCNKIETSTYIGNNGTYGVSFEIKPKYRQ